MSLKKITFTLAAMWLVSVRPAFADKVEYQRDIAPILKKHCLRCHGPEKQRSGLRLDRRADLLEGGDFVNPAVVPGKPEKSYLLKVVKHLDPELKMPPKKPKLPENDLALLTRWIEEGVHWPGQMGDTAKKKSDHWSFQPIVRPATPEVKPRQTNPIDAFLLEKLHEKGLTLSPPADARSLIRRASIVLTGLAPTPAEVSAFVAAHKRDSDEAYAALVDRLMASPHFGERWAQHWLDVIRWAETNGSESNMYRKNAWIYRDYVIRAFNEDKPYDKFLFEQIAGDTVGQGDATGYLVAGPHVPVATVGQEPAARRQARADRMDEMIQTVGASALGLTVGCARCHNHKFDPISIRDYYALSAVFQGVEFGGRFPELSEDHPRRKRGKELYGEIAKQRRILRKTGGWEEYWIGFRELHFHPVTTQSVRITFGWNSARIDELEIFGPENNRDNLALAKKGTKTFSPPEMAVLRSELHKINDGQYGTEAWAGRTPKGSKQKPWVQFTFTEPKKIHRMRLSSNREDFLETDYLLGLNKAKFGPYRVEIQTPDGKWKQITATTAIEKKNKAIPERAEAMAKLQALIERVNEEGPKPSFIGRFITPSKTHVLHRGSPESPREEVAPAGLEELDGSLKLPPNASGKARRKAFAEWLTDAKHPLTARVEVNRLWHHVFGQGIVTTTSDFGKAGAPPTNSKLADWLASELMQPTARRGKPSPWSRKHLIRLMVMSRAFRQSALPHDKGLEADADSALLWRFPPKRVEAEVLRDSILRASGSLDTRLGGRGYRIHNVKKRYAQWEVLDNHGPNTWRRMIYQERMRRVDDRMFTAFDFPDCGQVRAKRPVSTTPLQALNLMNSKFVTEQSQLIAARAKKDGGDDLGASVDRCFELLLSREPTREEREACVATAKKHGLALVCRALVNSNEFAFLP